MKETIEYRPYKSHTWIIPIVFFIGIICFELSGYLLLNTNIWGIVPMFVGVGAFLVGKMIYDSSNIVIIFEEEVLRIAGGNYKNQFVYQWNSFTYAYYVSNYKGHLFVLLTSKALNSKQMKKIIYLFGGTSKVFTDSVLLIYIDYAQKETEQIKKTINCKVKTAKTGETGETGDGSLSPL